MRLTQKRIERWQADVERAEALLERVSAEIVRYRGYAKGGRLSHLQDCRMAVEVARREARVALAPLDLLARSEARNAEARSHA